MIHEFCDEVKHREEQHVDCNNNISKFIHPYAHVECDIHLVHVYVRPTIKSYGFDEGEACQAVIK